MKNEQSLVLDQSLDNNKNISNQWSVPEENGPRKCPNWIYCKGVKNTRINVKKAFKTHTSLRNCPYQDFLVS